MLPALLPIIAHLLLSPCLAAEQQGVTLAPEPLATETAESGSHVSSTGNGSSLTAEDFKNGAKLTEELKSQDNSTKRAHFEQAMGYHQEEDTPAQKNSRGTVLRAVSKRWPNGVVPYILEDAFDENFRAIIAAAMADVHERTCIRWREKTEDDEDWVYIFTTGAQGCVATLGYVGPGFGEHKLALRSGEDGGCDDKGVVIHEMLHNLGVGHEQNRPDRDSLMSIDWTNIPVDKANQHWRHNWATDTENLPECSEEGVTQDTANFDNCVSGLIVEDFGVGYDKDSIMHYGITLFAIDDTKPVLIPKDSSITSLGGYELTDMDVLKLQKAYGCDGSCGGWAKSETGGDLDGKSSDNESPCEWILETSPGKGIEIAIIELTGPSDCSTDYLEVRLGDTKEGQLVGKYCSAAGSVKINNHKIWVKWVRSSSSPTLTATWNTFAFSCCEKVILENLDGQSSSQGYFLKQEERYKGYNFYKQEGGDNMLFQIFSGWIVSDTVPFDTNSWSFGVKNEGMEACPEAASGAWQYYGTTSTGESDWVSDSDAAVRCSDCYLYPAAEECAECCSELVGSTTTEGLNIESLILGNWVAEVDDFNGHKVYKSSVQGAYCMFFNNDQRWVMSNCDNLESTSMFMYAGAKKCLRQTIGWTAVVDGAWADVDITFTCAGGNPTPPAPGTTLAPTTKLPAVQCVPCKLVNAGPDELRGTYLLDMGNTEQTRDDCKDSCVYKREEDEEIFCFASGGFPVESCPAF